MRQTVKRKWITLSVEVRYVWPEGVKHAPAEHNRAVQPGQHSYHHFLAPSFLSPCVSKQTKELHSLMSHKAHYSVLRSSVYRHMSSVGDTFEQANGLDIVFPGTDSS